MSSTNAAWSIFNDKPKEIKGVVQYLSFADLELLPEFRLALMRQDQKVFERILFENGLDVDQGYNVKYCLHRPRTNTKVYEGFRVEANERVDNQWLNTGAASLDAYIYSSKDESLRNELLGMNPAGSIQDCECDVSKYELDRKLPEGEVLGVEPVDAGVETSDNEYNGTEESEG
jgi:hypothetical protein